jgi:hypothetical protein
MRHAGATAAIIEHARYRFSQANALVNLAQQQHAAVTDDIAAIESRFNHPAADPPQIHWFNGTIWHRRSSVVILV